MGQTDTAENQHVEIIPEEYNPLELTELKDKYFRVLKEIESVYTFFSALIFNIGLPVFTNAKECPTAKVSTDKITHDLLYVWNIDFFKSLTESEVKFVIVHETFHVLLDHLSGFDNVKQPMIYNVACDAVINDLLVKQFEFEIPEQAIRGEKLIGEDCSDKSAEYVYSKIMENAIEIPISMISYDSQDGTPQPDKLGKNKPQDKDKENKSGGGGGYTDEDAEENKDGQVQVFDHHEDWSDELAEELSEAVPFEYDIQKNQMKPSRGLGAGNKKCPIMHIKNKFSLRQLIKHIVGRKIDENDIETWRRFNYKFSFVYPEIILPYTDHHENKGKLKLLFCLDTSGSISDRVAQEFIAIAKAHMQDFDVEAISFDTAIYPMDLKKQRNYYGRGGTSFQAVVNYVLQQGESEYDVIFVLTDAWGGSIDHSKINTKKWFWIITPNVGTMPKEYGVEHRIPREYLSSSY